MNSLKYLNKYFYKYRLRLLLGILFTAISNVFGVYSVKYIGKAIDYLKAIHNTITPTEDSYLKLFYFGALIVLLAIISGFFLYLMRQSIIVMSRLIEYDLKNEMYNQYQKLDIAFYKRNNTGDLMNRISEDVGRVRMYIGPAIMYIVNTIITFTLTIVVMINIDFKLTVYVLLPLPILSISISLFTFIFISSVSIISGL